MPEPHSESPPPPRRTGTAGAAAAGASASRGGRSGANGGTAANGGGANGGNGAPLPDDVVGPPTPTAPSPAARADAASSAAAPAAPAHAGAALDRASSLWLAASQRMAGRAAHEVKNSLNAVAVNLEVVRSRLARAAAEPDAAPQPSPAAAARFAEVASGQFEAVSSLSDALLSLARAPREPADLAQLLAPLAVVYDAVARGDGGSLRVTGSDGGASAAVPAPAVVVRLALATALDAAVGRGRAVVCAVDAAARPPRLSVSWLGAVAATAPDAAAVAAVRAYGVSIAPDGTTSAAGALTITFDGPSAAGARTSSGSGARGDAPPNQDP